MTIKKLDQHNFPAHLAAHDIVVVKFGAPWCGPCKAMGPLLESAAADFPEISIVEVDVEQSPHLATQFNVRAIPMLVAWKNGTLHWAKTGLPHAKALSRDLSDLIAK